MRRKLQVVNVSIEVTTSSAKHCSNDCNWMEGTANGNMCCKLFEQLIYWDKRKKKDGYKRAKLCQLSQLEKT